MKAIVLHQTDTPPPPPADIAEIGRAHANELGAYHECVCGGVNFLGMANLQLNFVCQERIGRNGCIGRLFNSASWQKKSSVSAHKTTEVRTAIKQRLSTFSLLRS